MDHQRKVCRIQLFLRILQFLTSLIVNQYYNRETENGLIVKVDVGGYRKKRDEKLEKMATRIAKEVAKNNILKDLYGNEQDLDIYA